MSLRIGYVVSIENSRRLQPLLEALKGLTVTTVVQEDTIAVVYVESPFRHDREVDDRWAAIDSDLSQLAVRYPVFGPGFVWLDGERIGNRWPIVIEETDDPSLGPGTVETMVSWDNLLIRRGNAEVVDRLARVTSTALARYRVLLQCMSVCREILEGLRTSDPTVPLPDEVTEKFTVTRRNLLISRIMVDVRPELYWGCEFTLLEDLSREWNVDSVESAVTSAIESTRFLHDEHNAEGVRRANELQAAAARRLSIVVVVLTLFGGLSAVLSVIEFSWTSDELRWAFFPRGLIASALVALFAATLVFARQAISRAQAHS